MTLLGCGYSSEEGVRPVKWEDVVGLLSPLVCA